LFLVGRSQAVLVPAEEVQREVGPEEASWAGLGTGRVRLWL
jgi:hypothetical protein